MKAKKMFYVKKKKKALQCNVLSKKQGKVFNPRALCTGEMSTFTKCWRECVLIRVCRRQSGNACEKRAYFWTHNYQFQFRNWPKKITRQFENLAKWEPIAALFMTVKM